MPPPIIGRCGYVGCCGCCGSSAPGARSGGWSGSGSAPAAADSPCATPATNACSASSNVFAWVCSSSTSFAICFRSSIQPAAFSSPACAAVCSFVASASTLFATSANSSCSFLYSSSISCSSAIGASSHALRRRGYGADDAHELVDTVALRPREAHELACLLDDRALLGGAADRNAAAAPELEQ